VARHFTELLSRRVQAGTEFLAEIARGGTAGTTKVVESRSARISQATITFTETRRHSPSAALGNPCCSQADADQSPNDEGQKELPGMASLAGLGIV
jgi:hypothetical protein